MELEIRKYLFDIQQASQMITNFTRGETFENYQTNPMLKSAVERQFITVGEALSKAIKRSPDLTERISNTRKIIDFRNVLTHGYTNISDAVVWDILQTNLPVLMQEVGHLLKEFP